MIFQAHTTPHLLYEVIAVRDSNALGSIPFFFPPITTVSPMEFLNTSLDNIQRENVPLH